MAAERSITGTVWLDQENDGSMDPDDVRLNDIPVRLWQKISNGEYRLVTQNRRGEDFTQTKTDSSGTYEFGALDEGEYVVGFQYDRDSYSASAYQKPSVPEEKSSKLQPDVFLDGYHLTRPYILIPLNEIKNGLQIQEYVNAGLVPDKQKPTVPDGKPGEDGKKPPPDRPSVPPEMNIPTEQPPGANMPTEVPPEVNIPEEQPPLIGLPRAGDPFQVSFWLILLMVSGISVIVLLRRRRDG